MLWKAPPFVKTLHRIRWGDPTLKFIKFNRCYLPDALVVELVDCLLQHSHYITCIELTRDDLTDVAGVALARYLASSTTIHCLDLSYNRLTDKTYLAIATALQSNVSLKHLILSHNLAVDRLRINTAFAWAFHVNPDQRSKDWWWLYDFKLRLVDSLREAANQFGAPSMLMQLRRCERKQMVSKFRSLS